MGAFSLIVVINLLNRIVMPAEDIEITDPNHPTKKRALKWKRKTRVLMLCSRRVDYRSRHPMKNLIKFLPHSKLDIKVFLFVDFHNMFFNTVLRDKNIITNVTT